MCNDLKIWPYHKTEAYVRILITARFHITEHLFDQHGCISRNSFDRVHFEGFILKEWVKPGLLLIHWEALNIHYKCVQRMSWNIPVSSLKTSGALSLFSTFSVFEERNNGVWCYQTNRWLGIDIWTTSFHPVTKCWSDFLFWCILCYTSHWDFILLFMMTFKDFYGRSMCCNVVHLSRTTFQSLQKL